MVAQNKYVDEVYPHAPWIITEGRLIDNSEFLTKNNIDFVAHDDIPYDTAGVDDAYAVCKKLGKFRAT
jgi:choline-phosphate cytidylyltransferase